MTLDERLRETLKRALEWVNVPMQASDAAGLRERLQEAIEISARLRGGWISVKEELPEDEVSVLIYEPPSKHFAGCGIQRTCRYKGHWIMNHKDDFVTHWMPLPEAPK